MADITHFQHDGKYISAFHSEGELILGRFERVKHLAVELEGEFIQVSRSLLVRKTLIRSLINSSRTARWGTATIDVVGDSVRVEASCLPAVREVMAASTAAAKAATTGKPDVSIQTDEDSYSKGVYARDCARLKSPPGNLGLNLRSWWLAGWNDRDIELRG